MKEIKTWSIKIKGISCLINFWHDEYMLKPNNITTYPRKGIWNSYIIIDRKSIPDKFDNLIPKIKKTDYGCKERFEYDELPFDMAYGITYFNVTRKPSGKITAVKVGNDYNHIWNHEQYIDEKTIEADLEKTVEEILNLFKDYKVWSCVDGNYVKPEELDEYNKKAHAKLFKKII